MFRIKSQHKFFSIGYILILVHTFYLTNIFYDSTRGPDYELYSSYISYFFSDNNNTDLDQGIFYYFSVSFILAMFESFHTGQNHSILVSNSVQIINFIYYLIGCFGLYSLAKYKLFTNKSIFISLILLNFYPPLLQLRLTMKPEIFAFAILPWVLYNIELYLQNKKNINLLLAIIQFTFIVSIKGSISLMVGIFILILYGKKIIQHNLKILLIACLLFAILFTGIMNENYDANQVGFLENSNLRQNYGDYNYVPQVAFYFNVDLYNLATRPYLDNHANSMFSIIMLDTFNDYFHLYWNLDKSMFNRDQIIKNINTESIYIQKLLQNLEYYIGFVFSILFYILLIKYFKDKEIFYESSIAPLVGLLVVLLSASGFPFKNFNPSTADTIKVFYFGFLLSFAFFFLSNNLVKKGSNKKIIITSFIYIMCIFVSLGFPKSDNANYYQQLKPNKANSLICPVSNIVSWKIPETGCLKKQSSYCGFMTNFTPPKKENGNIEYFKDDYFGSISLAKANNVVFIEGYAKCKDYESLGFKNLYSFTRLKIPNFSLAIFIAGFLIQIYYTLYFRSSKSK